MATPSEVVVLVGGPLAAGLALGVVIGVLGGGADYVAYLQAQFYRELPGVDPKSASAAVQAATQQLYGSPGAIMVLTLGWSVVVLLWAIAFARFFVAYLVDRRAQVAALVVAMFSFGAGLVAQLEAFAASKGRQARSGASPAFVVHLDANDTVPRDAEPMYLLGTTTSYHLFLTCRTGRIVAVRSAAVQWMEREDRSSC